MSDLVKFEKYNEIGQSAFVQKKKRLKDLPHKQKQLESKNGIHKSLKCIPTLRSPEGKNGNSQRSKDVIVSISSG